MSRHNLSEKELKIIADILKDQKNVFVFGSRVTGNARKFSDLDLCLKERRSVYEYEILKEKFEESDLPFTVDLVEYHLVHDAFRQIIDKHCMKLEEFWKK